MFKNVSQIVNRSQRLTHLFFQEALGKNQTEVSYQLTDVDLQCADGWERNSKKCFRVYTAERSWSQALVSCARFMLNTF